MISIVCPFYNEEAIIEASLRLMLSNLARLDEEWELIVVSDGSKDSSRALAERVAAEEPRLKVLGYAENRGRGYAIRTGAAAASGDLLVTTEIDSSWGDDIVHRLVTEMRRPPQADIIIASPHLPGGGYRNIPAHRVFLSSFGNWIIRSGLTYQITMNTGMTRCYRRKKFQALPLDEDEKEMHLEVVNKALALGYRIREIPSVLEWKDHKLSTEPKAKRKSSAKLAKLIRTHVQFSLLAMPFRYLYPVAGAILLTSLGFLVWTFVNLAEGKPSIFLLTVTLALAIFGCLLVGIALLAQQNRAVMQEVWRLRSELRARNESDIDPAGAAI